MVGNKRILLIATVSITLSLLLVVTMVGASDKTIDSLRDQFSVYWSEEDQQESLENCGISNISYTFQGGDGEQDQVKEYSVPAFLFEHSGFIFSFPSGANEVPKVTMDDGQLRFSLQTQSGMEVTEKPVVLNQLDVGGAVPIAADGYFLTACHVLKNNEGVVLAYWSKEKAEIQSAWCRSVFWDKESDIAIIKTDLKTPNYLSFRAFPVEPGEVLFSGSWINNTAAGRVKETVSHSSAIHKQYDYSHILLDTPIIKGDSGSPLIDRFGKVCGVIIRSNRKQILWRKYAPEATAVIMKADDILDIIDQDRKLHSAVEDKN